MTFDKEVNQFVWNGNDLFMMSTAGGCVDVLEWPSLQQLPSLTASMANVMCIEIDPKGRYFATGSGDSLVGIWDSKELVCLRVWTLENA